MHALVIEKNEEVGKIFCTILEDEGFICKVIYNYDDAYLYLKTFSPDLVLIDASIDGNFEALLGLINDAHTVAVITSTALKHKNTKFANEFLLKPFCFYDLEKIILNVKNNIDKLNTFKYSERKLNNLKERRM